jgi:hypothetical protein
MNNEQQNLIDSFTPIDTDWLKEGTLGMYHEGVVKGKVKVLSKKVENGVLLLKLQSLENDKNRFPLPPIFDVGKLANYDGYAGWSILPLTERN